MSELVFQVTAAARAALINAEHDGTLPLQVASIGLTEQAFTAAADGSDTVLPGELKRLDTFAGDVVAADTIHVSVTDASADSYSLRGFGLYFADGTLLGLYGQADPIMEKSAQAMLLLAADVIFADIDVTQITFGDTNFALPPATTDRSGIVELATNAETTAGADGSRAVTPASLKAALDVRLGAGLNADTLEGKHASDFVGARWMSALDGATLAPGARVIPANATSALTLKLPTDPADGDAIEWRQGSTSFALHSVIFARNGRTIMGLAEDMTVTTDAACGSLVWRAALGTWRVYSTSTAGTV